MKKNKVDSKEVGLDIGLILAKHFYKTDYLHYGYWNGSLDVSVDNVHQAQVNYANFILDHIPEGVKTILDVGCGSGKFAGVLLDHGYEVDCVSPSPNLTRHVRKFVADRGQIFECGYEDVVTDKKYDLILFSESFQYIPLPVAISNNVKYLKEDGYFLVCDFFRKNVEGTSPIGGGHDLQKFYNLMEKSPFKVVVDKDITKETAPSMDIVNDFLTDVLHPIYDLIFYVLDKNYPRVAKFIRWKFKNKLEKVSRKYFQRKSNAESFSFFKSYHLLVYQKNS